jgi:hypothetical protein
MSLHVACHTRATKAQIEIRRASLAWRAHEHGPCSVRHIHYRAIVTGFLEETEPRL